MIETKKSKAPLFAPNPQSPQCNVDPMTESQMPIGHEHWSVLCETYWEAAQRLIEPFVGDNGMRPLEYDLYPIMYLYRHWLELSLKGMLISHYLKLRPFLTDVQRSRFDATFTEAVRKKMLSTHHLAWLQERLNDLISFASSASEMDEAELAQWEQDSDEIGFAAFGKIEWPDGQEAGTVIDEVHRADTSSHVFRYDFNKAGTVTHPFKNGANTADIQTAMGSLHGYFGQLEDSLTECRRLLAGRRAPVVAERPKLKS